MAAFDTTRPTYGATGVAGQIGAVFTAALGAVSAWNDRRMTRDSLNRLTDRELDDIGLGRGDIDAL